MGPEPFLSDPFLPGAFLSSLPFLSEGFLPLSPSSEPSPLPRPEPPPPPRLGPPLKDAPIANFNVYTHFFTRSNTTRTTRPIATERSLLPAHQSETTSKVRTSRTVIA